MAEDHESDTKGDLYYDENTLKKVYAGMEKAGITPLQARDAISQLQNLGILFRERGRL